MERYYSQTIGMEVMTEGGQRAGSVIDVVTDPDTGLVRGFLLAPKGKKSIVPFDVQYWSNRLVIRDADDVLDSEEIIHIRRVLEKNTSIIYKKVITENGQYLGKVLDYTMDNKMFVMTKILVAKSFLKFFFYDEKLIPRKNIVEIKKDLIVVKNTAGSIKVKANNAKNPKEKEKRKLHVDPAPTPG